MTLSFSRLFGRYDRPQFSNIRDICIYLHIRWVLTNNESAEKEFLCFLSNNIHICSA